MALPALAILLAGCATANGGPDFDVRAYNDSSETVQLRFRATFDATGEVVLERDVLVPPGQSVIGRLDGPRGDYHLEAWAFGQHAEQGPRFSLDSATVACTVALRNPDPVRIHCDSR